MVLRTDRLRADGGRRRQPKAPERRSRLKGGRRRRLGLGIRSAESRVGNDTSRRVRSAEDKAVIRRNVEISG